MAWSRRDILRTGAAILVTMTGWGILRLVFPGLDYFPPESLVRELERSWFISSGARKPAMAVYGGVALALLAVFFKAVQERWPGRGHLKGLAFGASLGVIWVFAFLNGWAFLGTTLRAEVLNGINDLIGLSAGGWLIGWAVGRDNPRSDEGMSRPVMAILLVATGFVAIHTSGANLLAGLVPATADLLLIPTAPVQFALLGGLGLWAGALFVVLAPGLPFESAPARAGFFAFGVFGHSWTWFHLFFVIEFKGVLGAALLVGLIGAAGVFGGALAYEGMAAARRRVGCVRPGSDERSR